MVSFEVVTAAGAPIRTFADKAKALAYAREAAETFPGAGVVRVERIERRLTLWRAPVEAADEPARASA